MELHFSEGATRRILAFIREEEETDLGVRVSVKSPSPVAPEYEMALVGSHERNPQDAVLEVDGFRVYVDRESAPILDGTRIDWVETVQGSGFRFENPNLKPLGSEPLSGSLAERVRRVIEERINPGVATHGGHVSLVDVRDDVVYLRMSGGCQGCSVASVTLTQGIKEILMEEVPEIAGIEDVTDHAAGRKPYYQ